jgi:hypothetical protein
MNGEPLVLDPSAHAQVLEWAVGKRCDLAVSLAVEGGWVTMRSRFLRLDYEQGVLQIAYPLAPDNVPMPEIVAGNELGLSFRRGHKKCIFVSRVLMRCEAKDACGETADALVLKTPDCVRALQRRAYQRVTVPAGHFVAVKLWEGGVPAAGTVAWPICSGHVANASLGGLLVDIREDQNPRLQVGDVVGVEVTVRPGAASITVDARYRHCVTTEAGRIGLGFQFVGLEHEGGGRSPIADVAGFVQRLRRLG